MIKEIYLAGGCFWGIEQYLQNIKGVVMTEVGYANGNMLNPTYDQVCNNNTGHAETVRVEFDDAIVSLPFILTLYYDVINPTSVNRQCGDSGTQYRTGIYYTNAGDRGIVLDSIAKLQKAYIEPIAIEVLPLKNYSAAEKSHQKYLDKNPNGYCHISSDRFAQARHAVDNTVKFTPKSITELQQILTPLQFEVTQHSATEPSFKNEYYDHFERGIYVDITTGEPLFVSADKFESGCGWPAFSKPIDKGLICEVVDATRNMTRTEVRSKNGSAHLGHVFEDGPQELGGIRYCINSASLRFVAVDDMKSQGYGEYLKLL